MSLTGPFFPEAMYFESDQHVLTTLLSMESRFALRWPDAPYPPQQARVPASVDPLRHG